MSGKLLSAIVALLGSCLGGCAHLRPAKAPLPSETYRVSGTQRTSTLIVFLPGRAMGQREFAEHGFIEELRRERIEADAIAVGAHLGYYYRRSIVTRLVEDVFQPARAEGYSRIVVVGISLGGLGGVISTRDAAKYVDALVLISPFLGDDKNVLAEIERVGGPKNWSQNHQPKNDKVTAELWTYLGKHGGELPPTWLLSGASDYLSAGQKLFASLLPPDHVVVVPGKHNWKTWEKLWHKACADLPVFAGEKK